MYKGLYIYIYIYIYIYKVAQQKEYICAHQNNIKHIKQSISTVLCNYMISIKIHFMFGLINQFFALQTNKEIIDEQNYK